MFRNTRKDNDRQPDHRGDFMGLDGVRYSIAAWEEDGGRLSLRIEPYKAPEKRETSKQPRIDSDPPKAQADEFSDSIPW